MSFMEILNKIDTDLKTEEKKRDEKNRKDKSLRFLNPKNNKVLTSDDVRKIYQKEYGLTFEDTKRVDSQIQGQQSSIKNYVIGYAEQIGLKLLPRQKKQ